MPSAPPNLEKLFFWLGFIAASLLWFLGIRYRRYWPRLLESASETFRSIRARFTAGVEETLRQETQRRAQTYHLSAVLFPLDQIAVEPQLLAPPPQPGPKGLVNPRKFFPQVVGYLPESPLFAAHYGSPRLTLLQALETGVNIALLGEPGAGKSFALAYLALQLARRDPLPGRITGLFPIFLHANDVLPFLDDDRDPDAALLKALQFHTPIIRNSLLNQFLRICFETQSAILLLDGLDEISPPEFERTYGFLAAMLNRHPGMRLVTTAAPQASRRMLELGVEPMALAGWDYHETQRFIRTWTRLWNNLINQWGTSRSVPPLDDLLVSAWLAEAGYFHTPAEWTLKVWAACAGNLENTSSLAAVKAHVNRELANLPNNILSELANTLISQKISTLPATQMENLFAPSPSDKPEIHPAEQLIRRNFLRKHPGGRLAFSSPWLIGFFASQADVALSQPPDFDWPAALSKSAYSLVRHTPIWLDKKLQLADPPLFKTLVEVSSWLRFIPQNHENKVRIFRRVLPLILSDETPISVRRCLMANIAASNDPSVAALFKQWLTSNSPYVRLLAVLGLGACREGKPTDEIAARLRDPSAEVRYGACFALAALNSQDVLDELTEVLTQGDEETKQVAAEVLAAAGLAGQELLISAAKSEDLLVRRAAVYGLSLVADPRMYRILEKIAIEDTHWVVRNAAAIALDTFRDPNPYLPKPRIAPSETPWLIEFAARSGRSVSRQEPPAPLLRQAMRSGSILEQISALWMIREIPQDPQLIADAQLYLRHADSDLRESAHYILWQLLPAEPVVTDV